VDHVARMEDVRNAKFWSLRLKGKCRFKNRSAKFENNIKVNFEGTMIEDVDLFPLAQDRY
jgi:hypothetical protein